ncbi:MAG: hypothetical protein ACLP59_17615 [Bryobacteraceae bacterium]
MGPRGIPRVSGFGGAVKALIEALGRSGVPYLIGGSVASGVHGIPRTSLDADLVADMAPAQVPRFIRELRGEFYADEDMIREALESGRSFNLIHLASTYKLDIFPLLSDPFAQSQFARREIRDIDLGGVTLAVPMATAEDTLLMKLVWYRMGGEVSERQWNDVLGIVGVQRERLDREYLRHWATQLKVSDLLDEVMAA